MIFGQVKHIMTGPIMSTIVCIISLSGHQAFAANATSSGLTSLVNKAKILSYEARVTVSGSEASLSAYANPKATENDLKIDAVLVAHAIMKAYPTIAVVRAQFLDTRDSRRWSSIEVHAGDVRHFAMGGEDKRLLLNSLIVHSTAPGGNVDSRTVSTYTMVNGHRKVDRTNIYQIFVQCVNLGAQIPAGLWDRFIDIENRVRSGEGESVDMDMKKLYDDAVVFGDRVQKGFKQQTSETIHLQPVPGYAYSRRGRIANKINTLAGAGQDMSWYQLRFQNDLEPAARIGQAEQADKAMDELEIRLGLSPGK